MELASMLAGESFSDHPASVCPVLGSLLRSYNDSVGDDARQDLYAYAAKVVGTRADADVERRRGECVAAWTYERRYRRMRRFLPGFAARRLCQLGALSLESIGTQAVRQIPRHTGESHRAVLGLIEDLLAIDRDRGGAAGVLGGPAARGARPAVSAPSSPALGDVKTPRCSYLRPEWIK